MIISRIRLKNIKSFGAGGSGEGVFIVLDRGLNRVGGANGSGKSTIIEAIGYALFDAEPVRGDNRVRVDTYLLRSGCKNGEIDVWVEAEDCLYRVERDVGQTLRRWKVVREEDGYVEAESEGEVRDLLARFWGLPDAGRLGEVYHGLIGVKQGHFTRPFDCTPKAAREHFDPLLDVDIFRECYDYLHASVLALKEQKGKLDADISGIEGQMKQLQDAPGRMKEAEDKAARAGVILAESTARVERGREAVSSFEKAMEASLAAERSLSEARTLWQGAVARHEAARLSVEESRRAFGEKSQAEPDYLAYRKAEEEYRRNEADRLRREQLRQSEGKLVADETRLAQEQSGLAEAVQRSLGQAAGKRSEAETRNAALVARRQALEALVEESGRNDQMYVSVSGWLETVRRWEHAVSAAHGRMSSDVAGMRQLVGEMDGCDPGRVAAARQRWQIAQERQTEAQSAYSASEEARKTLAKQLESISGGVCPFLGEQCRQFDPDRVQGRLAEAGSAVERCRELLAAAKTETMAAGAELEQAQQVERENAARAGRLNALMEGLSQLWGSLEDSGARQAAHSLGEMWPAGNLPALCRVTGRDGESWAPALDCLSELLQSLSEPISGWQGSVDKLQAECREIRGRRERESAVIENESRSIEALKLESSRLQDEAADLEQKHLASQERSKLVASNLAKLREDLAQYRTLDERMSELRDQMDRLRSAYDRYLRNEPLAGRLSERESALGQSEAELKASQEASEAAEKRHHTARAGYDETAHATAKAEFSAAQMAHGVARTQLETAEAEVAEQTRRAQTFQTLLEKRQEVLRETDRLRAQTTVLEKGRVTLKGAQAIVARGLTRHIQDRGQAVFNSMSPEPVQFEWDPEDYRLTIHTSTGSRRFTQLSGGQQMKVAIAMQLALVKEFSTAGLCAFDEPTYGLDAESRGLLADAIAQAQRECRFEQLLVVSHDEAFDDKVEHAVNLINSPLSGTVVSK